MIFAFQRNSFWDAICPQSNPALRPRGCKASNTLVVILFAEVYLSVNLFQRMPHSLNDAYMFERLAVLADYHFSPLAAAYLPTHCNLGKEIRLS
jgi:hypothetical protein